MTSIADKKAKIRERVSSERSSMNDEEWKAASDLIFNHLKNNNHYREAGSVHCYVSMNQRREVDTHRAIKDMMDSGKNVIVPITNFEKGTLSHVNLRSFNDLEENKWGVMEPQNGSQINPSVVDVVIVPLLAADKQGNRLGYGKGFYDRFLSEIRATKIALVFDRFIYEEIPAEDFDVRMDVLISEEGVYSCNNGNIDS